MKSLSKLTLFFIIVTFIISIILACSKDNSPTKPEEPKISPYAGVWEGTSSSNRPIYFSITEQGMIDSLAVKIKIYLGSYNCVITYTADSIYVEADSFAAFLYVPVTNVSTTLHGTFTSDNTATGTYEKFSGDYFFSDGNIFIIGTGGTQMSAGTWEASKQ